jgi:DNA polymerase II small subunit
MTQENIKKEIVSLLLKNNILVSPDFLKDIKEDLDPKKILSYISEKASSSQFLVMNEEINKLLDKLPKEVNWKDFDKARVLFEKEKKPEAYEKFIEALGEEKKEEVEKKECPLNSVNVLFSYEEESKKRDIQDFVAFFNARYKSLENILRHRQELQNILSINRILGKKDKESVSLIGLVKDRRTTSNGNLMLEIEDTSGTIKVLVSKNKPDLFNLAKDIVLDEIIGVVGVNGENIVFANNVIWPDVPLCNYFIRPSCWF